MTDIKNWKTTWFSAVILCLSLLTACNTNKQSLDVNKESGFKLSETEHNKLIVRRYMDALSTSQFNDLSAELLSPNYKEIRPEFHNLKYHASGSELEANSDPLLIAISDRRNSVDIVMGEDNIVVARYKILGKHTGNLYGLTATDKAIDIYAAGIFKLSEGKITEAWFMADEAGLLRQIGMPLPERADGQIKPGPIYIDTVTGDEHIAKLLANPIDSQEYRNKLMVTAYKAKNPPAGILPPSGRYGESFRRGFLHMQETSDEALRLKYPRSTAFPDRVDRIGAMIADGKRVLMQFKVTGTNTGSLFGIPASNQPVNAWEVAFMEFDGSEWKYAWFFGDDLGLLMQVNGPQDFWFQEHE